MQNIEIRVWHRSGRYFYFNLNDYMVCNEEAQGDMCPSYYDMEYELFTGFKDKKGKKIYEGDRCNVMTADGKITVAHVVFIDGCFELNFISPVVINGEYHTRDYLKCSVVNHAVEVIGDIHEN